MSKSNYTEELFMQNDGMEAVYDDDLVSLLKSLGVYEKVINGECHCIYCGKKITIENIDAIVPMNNSIAFTCNSNECHLKMIMNESGKNDSKGF